MKVYIPNEFKRDLMNLAGHKPPYNPFGLAGREDHPLNENPNHRVETCGHLITTQDEDGNMNVATIWQTDGGTGDQNQVSEPYIFLAAKLMLLGRNDDLRHIFFHTHPGPPHYFSREDNIHIASGKAREGDKYFELLFTHVAHGYLPNIYDSVTSQPLSSKLDALNESRRVEFLDWTDKEGNQWYEVKQRVDMEIASALEDASKLSIADSRHMYRNHCDKNGIPIRFR